MICDCIGTVCTNIVVNKNITYQDKSSSRNFGQHADGRDFCLAFTVCFSLVMS